MRLSDFIVSLLIISVNILVYSGLLPLIFCYTFKQVNMFIYAHSNGNLLLLFHLLYLMFFLLVPYQYLSEL